VVLGLAEVADMAGVNDVEATVALDNAATGGAGSVAAFEEFGAREDFRASGGVKGDRVARRMRGIHGMVIGIGRGRNKGRIDDPPSNLLTLTWRVEMVPGDVVTRSEVSRQSLRKADVRA